MFPHTVTLYNTEVQTETNPFRSEVINHITILRGVFLDASKAVSVRETGLEGADAVALYVPFAVEAVDGVTGEPKRYVGPKAFQEMADKSGVWTIASGATVFGKGEVLPPDGMPPEKVLSHIKSKCDHVYSVSKVDEKDFGALPHWEIGGV